MKSIKLIAIGILLFFAHLGQAQISVNVNVGTPPQWGPAGYNDVQYYYLPDIEAYYDVPSSKFIYYSGGTWVRRATLPSRYRTYDLYNGYKVVMTDYRGNSPYAHFKEHKVKYAKGYRGPAQKNYGERPNSNNHSKSGSKKKSEKSHNQGDQHGKGNHGGNGNGHKK